MIAQTKKKRANPKDYLDHDDIFYIKNHLAQGIPKERIAANVYCDIEDIEAVEQGKRKVAG